MKKFKSDLFALSKTGAIKVYQIFVTDNGNGTATVTRIHYAKEGGKEVAEHTDVTEGKNIGRSNETTVMEQALVVANTYYVAKQRQGYKDKRPSATAKFNTEKDGFVKPMLAQKFEASRVSYPCLIQPKFNGVRCIYENGKLRSRQGVFYEAPTHLIDALGSLPYRIDGELYIEGEPLQRIVSAVKKQGDLTNKVCLNVFDLAEADLPQVSRTKKALALVARLNSPFVKPVPTYVCENEAEVHSYYKEFVAAGYEGAIIRDYTGEYEFGYRSGFLLKYKEMLDEEFEIVGFYAGTGREEGAIMYLCITPEGNEFGVRPIGSIEDRCSMYLKVRAKKVNIIGEKLTVQFQEYSEDKVPIFPVGITIRDYE